MSNIIDNSFVYGDDFEHGNNIVIEPDVVVGRNVKIGNFAVLKSGTRFGDNINFADYCCTTGACIIGNNVNIRTGSIISKGVILEDCVYIGPGVITNHTKHIKHYRKNVKSNILVTRFCYGAIIGSGCWIIAGAQIAANSIIGGGSSVIKNILNSGVYIGNPTKLLRNLKKEEIIEGHSANYEFGEEIISKYLPGIINNTFKN